MLTSVSLRTRDLMQRALDAVELEGADLITTLVASAFVDGRNAASEQQRTDPPKTDPRPDVLDWDEPLPGVIGLQVARLPDLPVP